MSTGRHSRRNVLSTTLLSTYFYLVDAYRMCELHVNCFFLQKYSRELHPFPVLNKADMLTWPYILERLGCL